MAETTKYIEGGREVAKRLLRLAPDLRKRVLAKAMAAGAQEVQTEAVAQAPYYHGNVDKGHPPPGTLKHSIITKQIREKTNSQQVTYYVVPRKGKGQTVRRKIFHVGIGEMVTYDQSVNAYYWKFVEFGTAKMAARPFMRTAFIAKREAALAAIMDKMRSGLDQVIKGTQ